MRAIKIILELWCELAGFRLHLEYQRPATPIRRVATAPFKALRRRATVSR
ncbi:hypothetical protein [Nitrospirillum sp. BR 11163]|nr:hypothetical protein [Nitrospirillum sp. BR 11163]MEA1675463.1 hypothetical protein [Nitrospirillum sp. BR 11163]